MLSIAYGNSRISLSWSNKTVSFDDLCERLKSTTRTTESVEEYKKMTKAQKDFAKDKGGFVGGELKGGRRKRETVLSRSMLTLDIDHAEKNFLEKFSTENQYTCCLYSTHSHTPESPRYRLIVPLKRNVTSEEYLAIARYYAAEWGIDQFDDCSYRPHQLMYWPSTPSNGEYVFRKFEGKVFDPDEYLLLHPNWKDTSLLPTSSRESHVHLPSDKKQEDPLSKPGVVGAFCRAYPISFAIDKFLGNVYEEAGNRYHFIGADSMPGVQVFNDKWVYSNHASDPAYGKLYNAFDLVRVHKFGGDDEKKSFREMCEFAESDELVRKNLLKEKQQEAEEDFKEEEWEGKLEYEPRSGKIQNTLKNLLMILRHDPELKGIVYNELADAVEIKGDAPWKNHKQFWRDADDAQLICYVDEKYGAFSQKFFDIALSKVTDDRTYHPIKEFLDSLPAWDGVERLDTLFIDFFGSEDNEYVRAVTRKAFVAAVCRIYRPAIKFDTVLVLNGPQGVGKSTIISKMGRSWYSDSLTLSDMNDKTAAEKLQGYWILEIGELAGMKKADLDKVKAFASRQDDKYRPAYGRRVTSHPRQNVIFGTTNAENGYLRDITGNRRFWNVKTPGTGKRKPWSLTDEEVIQIWAEAKKRADDGEELKLSEDMEKYAKAEQADAMEGDERQGLVEEYLNTLLPEDWDKMDIYQRRDFLRGDDITRLGSVKRKYVSNQEIWCECFGKSKEDLRPADSYAIAAIMTRLKDWTKKGDMKMLRIYGKQRVYERKENGTT